MIIFIHFLIFTAFVFISDAAMSFSVARIERRIGLSSNFFRMFFNITPSYIRRLLPLFIVFMAVELTYLNIVDNKYFVLLPLLIIFLMTIRTKSEYYTHGITAASCFLSIIICILTARISGLTGKLILTSPFLFGSFIIAIFAVSIFDRNNKILSAINIAINLALNLYIISVFVPELSYIYAALASFGILYLQFLLHKVYPKFNLFQTMRQSLTIILSGSLICFIGNLFWTVFILGGM